MVFLVFIFIFGISGPQIQMKDFVAWLSLLFREFTVTVFKKPTTKASKSHSLYKCFDASFQVFQVSWTFAQSRKSRTSAVYCQTSVKPHFYRLG